MAKQRKDIAKGRIPTKESGSSFLFNPNLFNKKLDAIKKLPAREKESIQDILNKALEERLLAAAGKSKSSLEKVLKRKKIIYESGLNLDLTGYFKKFILPEAKKQKIPEAKIKAIQASVEKTPGGTLKDILQLDAPIKENLIIGKEFRKIQSQEFGKIVGLKADKLKKLTENDIVWEDVNNASLLPLVEDGTLMESQKDDLLVTADLTRLTGDNLELIKALKTPQLKTLEDFVTWDKEDWVKVIKDNKITVPDVEDSVESYAENIQQNIEKTFPSQYFLKRILKDKYNKEFRLLDTVEKLQSNNSRIIFGTSVKPESLNWKGISATSQKKMEKDLAELSVFSNTYRHLGIPEIVNDPKLDKNKKKSVIEKRLNALKKFQDNNPNMDLYRTDFLGKNNGLNWQGIGVENQKPVKGQMLAYQRVQTLTDNYEISNSLLKKGLDSAMAIASIPEEKFVQISGLEYESSRLVYLKAKENALVSSHYFEAVRDAMLGTFNSLAVANQNSLVNDLKEIDGFDDLFGNQDFCDCEHCRSILGPAAYFTDLMYFIQENVSKKLFDSQRLDHPLYLKNRRPDLWNLKLTCENTKTEIPYLQVVNEVLGTYIEEAQGTSDVFSLINSSNISTTLPVNLPHEELRVFIAHFNLSLYEIFKTLKQPRKAQLREKLHISEKELSIITNANPTETKRRFGNETLTDLNVQTFLEYARIKREELDDLLKTKFSNQISSVKVYLKKDPSDIQTYSEVLKGLTDNRLDIIHRYLRLWKKTNWTIREFDLLLNSFKSAGLINNLNDNDPSGDPKILMLAELAIVQNAFQLSPEELASIVDEIPLISVKESQKSLFERLFDLEKIFGVASIAVDGTKTYNTNVIFLADKTQNKISPLLLAGLGISESELEMIFAYLGIDTSVDQQLDYAIISQLFRHSRIARGLKWTIEDLIGAMQILFSGASIDQLDHVHKLIEFNKWLQKSSLSVSDLLFILNGTEASLKQFKSNNTSSAAAILEIQNAPELDKKELLQLHLQQVFNLTSDQLRKEFLPKLVTIDINGPGINTALNASFDQPDNLNDFNELTSLMRELERVTLLFDKLEYSPEAISFFVGQKDLFGITDLKALTLPGTKLADFYRTLIIGDDQNQEANIQKSLTQYQTSGNFSDESLSIFANDWKQPVEQLKSLANSFSFSTTALEAVKFLLELNELSKNLGLDGHNLVKLTVSDYSDLLIARDVTLGAFSAKYPEEDIRKEKLEPYIDKINTIKRDALCDYIIGLKDRFKFQDRSDLYYFFLLDVEMSGCFRTSRIVSAISSLQLYIHRCLINLEQSDVNLNPSIEDVKVIPTWIPGEEWEWRKNYRVWEANRKVFLYSENYIDPALRDNKTHLFKELEDELLQEKITQDSAEAAYKKYLAQFSELTKMRFAGAYYHSIPVDFNYWNFGSVGFDGFYLLTGIYFAWESEESEYYLFARTNVDPYQYYYRTYNHYKQVWGNWIKMEMAIEAEELSALVFRGKLYVFWTEVQTKELSKVKGGDSRSNGAIFKVYTKYSFLNENNKWSTPQRVYVGFMHSEEDKVFERVQGSYPANDEKERDRRHDYIFEQFVRRVFRKPYTRIDTGDNKTPLKLSYIWSQYQGLQQVKYYINSQTRTVEAFIFELVISIPYTDFLITNNQFGGSIKERQVIASLKYFGNTAAQVQLTAKIILYSSSTCIIDVYGRIPIKIGFITTKVNFNHRFTVSVNSSTLPISVFASHFDLSLSQKKITNTTTGDIKGDDISINNALAVFLKKEYDTAFSENGSFDHYIESGSSSFTSLERKVTQSQAGDGMLLIPGNNGNQDTIPTTTTFTDELMDILYAKGLEQFLSLQTQKTASKSSQQFDIKGAYGEYYWEMFFHIPFLIANHLNANQKFKEAKWWYERIFNPTSEETPGSQKPSDHNWQFCEFRNLNIEKLKDILTDSAAIEAYEDDPFNPHAIARLRANAYQKAIVMKYIDNLIDWGDYLFTQDTRESINEALMLYQLAYDILGKRPVKLGKCETTDENTLTFEKIEDRIKEGSEFLITLENSYWVIKQDYLYNIQPVTASKHLVTTLQNANLMATSNQLLQIAESATNKRVTDSFKEVFNQAHLNSSSGRAITAVAGVVGGIHSRRVAKYDQIMAVKENVKGKRTKWIDIDKISKDKLVEKKPRRLPIFEMVKESLLVFCVPNNADLLEYWDRVENRLYKIRHCMNISGVRRSLALFQPPIDPMFLVRARAAGLSMDDLLALIVPPGLSPYRFEYLVEKAKQFTQTVQGFGNALLSAMEKKDVEELTLLRSVHEQNILKLTKDVKKKQLQEAQYQHKAMEETLKNVQNRINYYQGLIDTSLIPWERTQQIAKHTSSILQVGDGLLRMLAGIGYLVPQVGSPFAMKYGGKEFSDSASAFAEVVASSVKIAEAIAASAGLEASFQRREEEWDNQLTLASQEEKQVNQQLLAAEIRQLIAEKDLEIHKKSIEHAKELHSFYKDKFTNLGLYNFLSSNLSRIYRQAYNIAIDMAKLAEQAYQFEQNDTTFFIAGDNWESDKAGLLAGDRLLLQLQKLEQAYIKRNVRKPEITQTFSLAMLDPSELINLRQTGTCTIIIPEIAFELFYPGQYRRLIKSVRLTIPSVVGPYTNVSAKLTLSRGKIEKDDQSALEDHHVAENTSINTSGAINDAGMFDFNFRDERYLPFEGGGAISEWQLELPSKIRAFNYDTISDVLITISYTALDGDRATAENDLETELTEYATDKGLFRLVSLKHEFPNAFHRLFDPQAGGLQFTEFNIENSHFPYFLRDKNLVTTQTNIYLKPQSGKSITLPASLKINGANTVSWNAGDDLSHSASTGDINKVKGGTVSLAGSPIKKWDINAGVNGLIKDELDDILILIKYSF